MARGGYTRRQLKEDRFADAAAETLHWTVEHRRSLVIGGVSAALVLGLLLGYWFYRQHRETEAGMALGNALRIRNADLTPQGAGPEPGALAFRSSEDRARAAREEFQKVAGEHSGTRAAELARYFLGTTALEMGDMQSAESVFQEVAALQDVDLAALARMGLASVYRATERPEQALDIYRALAESPTSTVPRATAQLEKAAAYEAMQQPGEARRIYELIRADEPTGYAAQVAGARLQTLR